ncbi:ROK family transcriptional regulator [Allorhizocola rhizosphaerae]|uniref:ROK family transcriptional regulator n=1 Tax=Allorhizocola rhizosphaerae TaxID=1872709 RepID=UPI000E3CD6B7|nr:ROK family transcriptional regulator [Allorhizocola rhizosphaerae]
MTRLAGSSKLLRAMNESATLALLLERGTLTRAELRELTGLSKPTTSDVLRTLTDAGFAMVVGHTSGGPGPNAEIYAVNPAAAHVVALSVRDITETPHPAVGAALCNLSGTVLARHEYDIKASDPMAAVAHTVADLCGRAGLDRGAVTHVQLAVPGSYDPGTDTIVHIDVAGWGRPGMVSDLASELDTTVGADNDVNLAAFAERHRGVARGAEGFALLWFGAGLGCAIDLRGTILRGVSGAAGELGYVPVGLSGKDLHDLVGGPAVLALAAQHGFTADTPEAAVTQAVVDRGQHFLRELAERIALALAAVSAILDPPLVVLAGEVAQAGGAMLRDLVADAFHGATPLRTPIEVTALTDDAVLLGALDAGLRAVRDSLIDSLRHALAPA